MVNHVLTVRGRKASVTPRTLVQGTVGHDTLTLDLDSEWNGLNVTVTFVAATTEVTPVLNANMCEIPHEVLVDSGEVDVFVLGTRDGKAMRHASLAHKMVVKKSNMSDGSTTADPSISAYRQAYDDAVKATEAANSAAGAAGSTAAEMANLNKRYEAQIEQQATAFSTDQIQRANDFSTAQTQRASDFDSAMQGYENAFNEAEGERASAETWRAKAEEERGKAEEKRAQDSKTRLEELAQAKTNAETATGEANTARDEAKKAATDATSAAGKATDAAGLAETAKANANTAAEEANYAATKAEAAARKADGAAETAGNAASTAAVAANNADTAAGNAESMAEKADASANKADIAAGKANEATVAATNAATKANEVEAKLTGNVLKGNVKDTFVHVEDAFPSSLLSIDIEGACKQDGTPSPDNPVPIEVIEHTVVKVCGRNLLNTELLNDENNFDNNQQAGGFWVYKFVTPSTGDYTVSVRNNSNYYGYLMVSDNPKYGAGNQTWFSHSTATNGATHATFNNVDAIYLYTSADLEEIQVTLEKVGGIQIEKGSTATALEPYTSQAIAFTLPAEHPYLAKLPDGTADEIVVDKDGNVELVARVGVDKDVRKVSYLKQGQYYELNTHLMPFASSDEKYECIVLCSALQDRYFSARGEGIYRTWTGIYVKDTSGRTKEEIQAEVDRNAPLTVAARIPETRYPLGKIEMPKAQDSIVNVWTDAEVTPRTGIEYMRDVNIVVENLESAIASITEG